MKKLNVEIEFIVRLNESRNDYFCVFGSDEDFFMIKLMGIVIEENISRYKKI